MLKKVACFLLVFVVCTACHAWHANGHRLVAQIAYDNLTPSTKQKIKDIFSHWTANDKPMSFIKAATWPDEIKLKGIKSYNHWHYIDIPYIVSGTPKIEMNKEDAIWAINRAVNVLQDADNNNDKPFYLIMLIHLIGDIHQPLHTITRFSSRHPKGDQGGNLYLIDDEKRPNLHSYWDSGAGIFEGYQRSRNVKYIPRAKIKKIAKRFERQYTYSDFQKNDERQRPLEWAKEGYNLAIIYAYDIAYGKKPSFSYQKKAQRIIKRQITTAGYRLATLLNDLFSQ